MSYEPRADQIGSLRRPDVLRSARERFRDSALSETELREVEDAAIVDALRRQHDAGIDVVTDGEYRRDAWQTDISQALNGFAAEYPIASHELANGTFEEVEMHTKAVESRLSQSRRITAHEVEFLQHHAGDPFKITMPSPNTVVWGSYKAGITDLVYPSRDELREDLVPIYRAELAALLEDGVGYVQLDEGFIGYVNPDWRDRFRDQGADPVQALAADIATEPGSTAGPCHDGVA